MSDVPLQCHVNRDRAAASSLQGYLTHKTLQPPWDHHKAPGTGLLQGSVKKQFLMSEVPLYSLNGCGIAQLLRACTEPVTGVLR
jgi:hypothetical protein